MNTDDSKEHLKSKQYVYVYIVYSNTDEILLKIFNAYGNLLVKI